MPTTPRGLVYPATSAAPNVPADLQALAESVESVWDNQPYCFTQNNAAQSFGTSGTWAVCVFDTDNSDVLGMHSTSSNTSRIVAPSAGFYICSYNLSFAANATGQRAWMIRKNANAVSTGGTGYAYGTLSATAAGTWAQSGSVGLYMAATDYVELFGYQNSGSALSSLASTSQYPYNSLSLLKVA